MNMQTIIQMNCLVVCVKELVFCAHIYVKSQLSLLDEPFGKLDAFTKMEIHSWLLNSWHQEKQTIVMVTHDLDEAILLSDRVFILSQRPASIVGEVQVKLPRPRTMDMLTSLELKKDKEEILSVLAPYMKK